MDIGSQSIEADEKTASVQKPLVPAVEQACHILLRLAESQRKVKVGQIALRLGMHRGKVHAILQALVPFGFVEKDEATKTYSLGPTVIYLARSFLDNLSYPRIVEPFLEDLATETSSTAVFGFISGTHIFVVAKHEGNPNLGITLGIGHKVPIALGAHGKAILAFMPENERRKILSNDEFYFNGRAMRLDKIRLEQEFVRCRESGFARDAGEVTQGVNVASAPVFGLREKVIGCINLFGTFPEAMIDVYGPKVAEVARQVSYKIGADLRQI